MLLLVTFFPVLVRLGVSKASAAAMIGLCAFMDLGPAVGTANLAAKHAGMESAIYFAHYQMPVAAVVMLAVAVVIFFTAKYFDKKDGFVPGTPGTEEVAEEVAEEEGRKVPAIYALLPVLPVILVLSPLAIASIKIDVVTAMILGVVVAFFFELFATRDFRACCKGRQVFFKGMGRSISPVAGIIIAVSKAGECSPFMIVRRTLLPALAGIAAMLIANYVLI